MRAWWEDVLGQEEEEPVGASGLRFVRDRDRFSGSGRLLAHERQTRHRQREEELGENEQESAAGGGGVLAKQQKERRKRGISIREESEHIGDGHSRRDCASAGGLKKEEGSEDSEDRISLSVGEGLVLRYANEHKQGHIVRKRVAADEGAQQKETEDPQRDDSLRFFRLRVTFLIVHYLFVTRTLEKKQKGGDHHHHTENERHG